MSFKYLSPIENSNILWVSLLFQVLHLFCHVDDVKIIINEDKICTLLSLFLLKYKDKYSFVVKKLHIYPNIPTNELILFFFYEHERIL